MGKRACAFWASRRVSWRRSSTSSAGTPLRRSTAHTARARAGSERSRGWDVIEAGIGVFLPSARGNRGAPRQGGPRGGLDHLLRYGVTGLGAGAVVTGGVVVVGVDGAL